MNTHHESIASKTHNTNATMHHANQAPVAQRAPLAGSLRQRGSSNRNQGQKTKKHQPDSHDTSKEEFATNGSTLEKRLASMRSTRLDLSLPRQILAPTESSVRHQSLQIQPFQTFPATIIEHENQGHHLTELWLTNHHLGSLPAEMSVFRKLHVLGLAGNKLTALPEELSQLAALEALYLDKNRIQILPSKLVFPPHLRELRLDNNQLTVFPTQITKLRLLNRLGLSYNQIKVLPESIHRLRNLVELDLDYNRLDTDLPDGFAALQRLERLGLEGNYFAEKPAILDRLPVLSYIRLSGNRAKNYLPTTNGAVIGSTRQLLAVPKRHDGYFQCVEGRNKNQDAPDQSSEKEEHRNLDGLVPSRDQNILNMLTY